MLGKFRRDERREEQKEERTLKSIKVKQIVTNPYQPRKTFDEQALDQLAQSIEQYGVLNPLTVRRVDDGYELIAGERRLRASKIAGLAEVPCIVMEANEQASSTIALVENLQRRDLDFFEEAWGMKQLIEQHGLTQEEAAKKVGKTQSAIANKLRLLKLSPHNMKMILNANLTERHARALLRLPTEEQRIQATERIIQQEWNVSRSEQYIEKLLQQEPEKQAQHVLRVIKDVRLFLNSVDKAVSIMKDSGVEASVVKEEQQDGMLIHISIPHARQESKL